MQKRLQLKRADSFCDFFLPLAIMDILAPFDAQTRYHSADHALTGFLGFVGDSKCFIANPSSIEHAFGSFPSRDKSGGMSSAEKSAQRKEVAACKAQCRVKYSDAMKQCKEAMKSCKQPVKQENKSCKSSCKKSGLDLAQLYIIPFTKDARSSGSSFL